MEKVLYNRKLHFLCAVIMGSMAIFYICFMYENGFNYRNLFAVILGLFCLTVNVNVLRNKLQ